MRPTAGKAALRPAQKLSRSASECRDAAGGGAVAVGDGLDRADQVVDLDARPVQFDDEQRLAFQRIAGMDEILGGLDRQAVHHLHAAGDDAGADDVGDALAGRLAGGKADQQRARRLGLAQHAHGDLGDDAEQAFRAGHDAEQIVAFAHRDACRRGG